MGAGVLIGVLDGVGDGVVADGFAVVHFGVVVYEGEVGARGGRDRAEMSGEVGGLGHVWFAVGDVVVVEEFGGEALGRGKRHSVNLWEYGGRR